MYDRQFKQDDPAFAALSDTITKAANNNILVVASAGNANSTKKRYPAAFKDCLSVGAISQQRSLSNFTINEETNILAPGENLTLLDSNNATIVSSGTSFATPFVVGVCALYLSRSANKDGKSMLALLQNTASGKDTIETQVNENIRSPFPDWALSILKKCLN